MVISTADGVFKDKFDWISSQFRPAETDSGDLSSGRVRTSENVTVDPHMEYGGIDFNAEFDMAKRIQQGYDKQMTTPRGDLGVSTRYKDEPSPREHLKEYLHSPIRRMERILKEDPQGSPKEHLAPRGEQQASNFPSPFEDVNKYVPGSDKQPKHNPINPLHFWEDPKTQLPPVLPMQPGGSPLNQNIDRNHHVPLAASGILDEHGNMTGLAIDHRAPDPPDPAYFQHVALHEATEIPFMHNRIAEGATPQEAYHEGHDVATRIESNAVRGYAARSGLDPDKYLDGYKQYWRDVASAASQPSDKPRHPSAHTTVHGLDEAELQYPNLGHSDEPPKDQPKKPLPLIPEDEPLPKPRPSPGKGGVYSKAGTEGKYAGDVVDFPHAPQHPPMQIDVLGQGLAMHSGPGPFIRPGKKYKGFANDNQIETAADKMLDLRRESPDTYKYYRAMYEQKGGEEWEDWKKIEKIIDFIMPKPIGKPTKGGLEVIKGGKRAEDMSVKDAIELMKKHPGKSFEEVTGEDEE
jgi:hypothetical protein